MTELASLVLFVGDLGRATRFYRTIGIELRSEDHGDGTVHAAAEVAGVHVALHEADAPGRAPARRAAGSTFPGVYVPSLDQTQRALEDLGARLLTAHEQMPWGCRVVLEDPDGRPVEINERGHCP